MSNKKFAGFDTDSAEAVEAPLSNSAKKPSKVFAPGLHSVSIIDVVEKGPAKNDGTWEGLWLTLEGTGGKTIYTNLQYPTESMVYNGDANSFPAQKFLAFLGAMGLSASPKQLPALLAQLFSTPAESLVGAELQVNVGYTTNHVVPVNGRFQLTQKYGRPVTSDGEPQSFASREDAGTYCEQNKLKFTSFPEVTEFVKSQVQKELPAPKVKAVSAAKKAW